MEQTKWLIKYSSAYGPEGWYWGRTPRHEVLLDHHGPFPTAADAALDMVRTWAVASAQAGVPN